jgi:hypothetical protein
MFCILGGVVLVVGGCICTCTYIFAKKAKPYFSEAQKNPQLAAFSLAASLHPDIEVVSKDEAAGQITLRNKKTGEVVKLDLSKYSTENIGRAIEQFSRGQKPTPAGASRTAAIQPEASEDQAGDRKPAEEKISPARAAAQTATLKQFPNYIPIYRVATTLEATINTFGGNTIGSYAFATGDTPETVMDFYEKKFTGAGFQILTKASGSNDNGPTASLVAQRASPTPQTSLTLMAEIQSGKTRGVITFTQVSAP